MFQKYAAKSDKMLCCLTNQVTGRQLAISILVAIRMYRVSRPVVERFSMYCWCSSSSAVTNSWSDFSCRGVRWAM